MDKRDEQILLHIYTHCKDLEGFINRFGNTIDNFKKDRAFYNSVYMSLMQISELSRNLTSEFIESTREQISWSAV